MHSTRPTAPLQSATHSAAESDSERERQEYLDETHLESTQYGVGRYAEDIDPGEQ